jgi:orotate phosphoribosyltransferase
MNYAKELAKAALKIKAIKLNPDEPFKWASGYYMPIYNDNRKFLVFPEYRKLIVEAFASLIEKKGLKFDVIAGVATAGIPHAVSLSDKLDFPVVYVRNKQKAHGMQNQIEGAKDLTNKKVIVIEDCNKSRQSRKRSWRGSSCLFSYL